MTRLELLTVACIIGVVGTASGFAVMSARSQTRDIARVAHVRDVQLGLELYFSDHAGYPVQAEALPLGTTTTACLSQDGFTAPCSESGAQSIYVNVVPAPLTSGLGGRSSCGGVADAYCYGSDGVTYGISFELEHDANLLGLQKGLNCAVPGELRPGACPTLAPAE